MDMVIVFVYMFFQVSRCKWGFHDTMFVFRVGLIMFIVFCVWFTTFTFLTYYSLDKKMLTKINPEGQKTHKVTWTSRFVRLLIYLCFFPISIQGKKVCFSWLSWKILVHFAIGTVFMTTFSFFGLSSINFIDSIKETLTKVRDIIKLLIKG